MGEIIDLKAIREDDEYLQRYLTQFWNDIAGPILAHRTIPGGVRNGVLTVVVPNDAWSEEMATARYVLRKKINDALGEASPVKVLDINFVVPNENGIPVGKGV